MSATGRCVLKSHNYEVMCWTWQDGHDSYEVRNGDGDAVEFESIDDLHDFANEVLTIEAGGRD